MNEYIGFVTLQPAVLIATIIEKCTQLVMAFEGRNFERYDWGRFGVVLDESVVSKFQRNTRSPRLEFLILKVNESLKAEFANELRQQLNSDDLIHVQINQGEQKVLQANDSFDRLGVYVETKLGEEILPDLLKNGVIEKAFFPPNYPD